MRREKKYKYKFDRIVFNNRWKKPFWNRNGTWVIVGFGKRFFSSTSYEYYLNFFGLDIRFWFERYLIKDKEV